MLQIFYFSLPVGVILLVLRVPLVRLAFGAKNFPWEATLTTAKVVGFLSLFLAAKSSTQLLIRTFYALQNTFIPLILRIINVLFSVGIAVVLIFRMEMGIVGLALAEGIGEVIFALLLFVVLHKKVGKLFKRDFFIALGKMLLAAFLTALTLWGLMRGLDRFVFNTTRTLNLIFLTLITLLVGGSVYLGFSLILDIEQLKHLLLVLKKFGRWKEILAQTGEILETRQPPALPSEKE
jgi:putative peptidoglycan lipid II flippase